MKSAKPSYKSFKNLISKTDSNSSLSPDKDFGVTIIPIGDENRFIALPRLKDTYTFNIINAAEMTGNITLRTSRGASLKGLILNTMNGNISIDPIDRGATSFEMGADMKDGCFVQTVSNGRNWFIWSVSTNGTYSFSRQGSESESGNESSESSLSANVIVDSLTATTTFPNLQARHDLEISGRAEPGSTITISEDGGAIQPFTIQVASDGTWSTNAITNLSNGSYSFDFIGSVGNSALNEIFADNTGALTFTTPSSFTVERGETFDFSTGAFALDPDGNQINTFTIDDSAYNTNLTHGATFDIVYSFTYNSQTYTRTVSGTVEDTAGPEAPVSNPSTINGNTFAIDGTTEPGSTVAIYFDGVLQGEVTADPVTGAWEFEKELTAPQTFSVTTEATDTQGNVGDESDPVTVEFNPTYPEVTLELVNAAHNVWTNVENPIQISGTTDVGATVTVYNGSQLATLTSGPTYDGSGGWTAAMNVADESITTLTAIASLNGYSSNGSSSPRTARVDRVAPTITLTGAAQTVYLGDIGETNDEGFSVNDNVSGLGINSGAGSQSSDWSTVVVDSEGTYTVTYNATDAAGNSATSETRDVTVTTEVIVPTNLVAVDNGDGTVTLTGDVLGTYADNLQVKINVIDSDGLEAVYQQSSSDVSFDVTSGSFTAIMILDADTYTFEAQTINSIGEASLFDDCTASGPVTVTLPAFVSEDLEENGTLTNASIVGGVLVVTGASSYTTLPMSSQFQSTTSQTMSMWFKSSTYPSSGQWTRLIGSHFPNQGEDGFFLELRSPASIYFKGVSHELLSDGDPTATVTYSLTDGEWHHIILSWNVVGSNEIRLWIDGERITVLNNDHVGAAYVDPKPNLFIGNRHSFSNPIEIDKVDISEGFIDDDDALSRFTSDSRWVDAQRPEPVPSDGLEEDGTLNNAWYEDGALVVWQGNSYTSLPMTSDFRSSTNQTMSMWFKSSTTPTTTNVSRLLGSQVIGQGPNGFFLELRSPVNICFKGASHPNLAVSDVTAQASFSLTDGNWHFITLSWSVVSSNQIRVWVDGQPITVIDQNHVGAGADIKTLLFIGNRNSGYSNPMEIDRVSITEEFIDDAEALSRYNSEPRSQP